MNKPTDTELVHITPTKALIIDRMKTVNDKGNSTNLFYERFAEIAAEREIVSAGVLNAWLMAVYDAGREYDIPRMIFAILDMQYDDYMRSLFPENVPFVEACIAWHQYVEEATK